MKRDDLIIVRGGGDLATGTIHRLWAAGLRVLVLEIENPAAIRRQVALCEAVYTKTTEVEGLRAVRIDRYEEAEAVWQENSVPILIDPKGVSIGALKPAVVIDVRFWQSEILEPVGIWHRSRLHLVRALRQVRMWMLWWRPSAVTGWGELSARVRQSRIRDSGRDRWIRVQSG